MIATASDVEGSVSVIMRSSDVKNGSAANARGDAATTERAAAGTIAARAQKRARMHNLLVGGPPPSRPSREASNALVAGHA